MRHLVGRHIDRQAQVFEDHVIAIAVHHLKVRSTQPSGIGPRAPRASKELHMRGRLQLCALGVVGLAAKEVFVEVKGCAQMIVDVVHGSIGSRCCPLSSLQRAGRSTAQAQTSAAKIIDVTVQCIMNLSRTF